MLTRDLRGISSYGENDVPNTTIIFKDFNNSSASGGNFSTEAGTDIVRRDDLGAMMYVVVVICVYSFGMGAFIVGHIYRKSARKRLDGQISDFFTPAHEAKLERLKRLERVYRTSLSAPDEQVRRQSLYKYMYERKRSSNAEIRVSHRTVFEKQTDVRKVAGLEMTTYVNGETGPVNLEIDVDGLDENSDLTPVNEERINEDDSFIY
ncbi:hypothetical protein DPMN_083935 [Dreissena polymorpha]|uniref:Uncharacterized protein n=1 Tax=Dreissena polymorpha TaxID=45954 RepID=A0A9D3YA85_DREPO|nr:hypothetical protein DPMN_083935 [Dreissena polymorpha]